MRAPRLLEQAACWLAIFCGPAGLCQEFHNLDFELAKTADYEPMSQAALLADVLPYWQASLGGRWEWEPIVGAKYNFADLDIPQVGLYGGEGRSIFPPPLEGNYSAFLYAAMDRQWFPSPEAHLFQAGLIPAQAKSVRFTTTAQPLFLGQPGALTLSIGGRQVPYVLLETGTNSITWGADVTSLAGTVTVLCFSLYTVPPGSYYETALGLDNIEFSPAEVPEPSAMALAGFGLFFAAVRRIFRGTIGGKPQMQCLANRVAGGISAPGSHITVHAGPRTAVPGSPNG